MAGQLTAAEAARRLGVKPATLYAYVSRGVLTRRKDPAGRTSRFDAQEIEDLARRGRPRRQAGAADIVVESALTEIDGAQFRYRGLDVAGLATRRTLEEVAEFLRRIPEAVASQVLILAIGTLLIVPAPWVGPGRCRTPVRWCRPRR